MPFIVAQWNPTIDLFNNSAVSAFFPLPHNTINTYTSGIMIVRNRSYLDLYFLNTDGRSFYVEQETARAFYFPDFQTWNFSYKPIDLSGMMSNANLLPYQQVTMEIFLENERMVEAYPYAYPVFTLPATELVAHGAHLFMCSNGVHTSPASGNIPMALFFNTTLNVTATILSVRVSTNVAVASAATIESRVIFADPALTSTIIPVNMSFQASGVSPVMRMQHQNTSVTVPAGTNLVTGIVDQDNTVTELMWPAVYVIGRQATPGLSSVVGGLEFFFEPAIASSFSWTALWKEEQF